MAEDARSLLQSERNACKIKHPHASYTSAGQLLCNVCDGFVKSNNLWEPHLRSEQHISRLKQTRHARATAGEQERAVNRKRKAEDGDLPESKRSRNDEAAESEQDSTVALLSRDAGKSAKNVDGNESGQDGTGQAPEIDQPEQGVDEYEWDAFERDMAELENSQPEQSTVPALAAVPTIEAAPLSAAELAAQAREEQSAQKGRRETEIEEEKAEASTQMDEEMSRMAQLDEKMKSLRQRREAIRRAQNAESKESAEGRRANDSNSEAGEESLEENVDEWGGLFGGAVD